MPTLEDLEAVARHGAAARPLDDDDRTRIGAGRAVVERALAAGTAVYGVTTGFGQLESVRIAPADAAQLQVNLLRSHAVGSGPPLPEEIVRGMLMLLASSLRRGHSGVRVELVELALALLERGVTPVVPSKGSVGSSGDLAPLAHLGLVLIGEGEATVDGETLPGGEALTRAGLAPVELTAKEGLALINGTHLMAAAGALAVRDARRLLDAAIVAVALQPGGVQGLDRAVRRPPARPARPARPGDDRLQAHRAAGRQSRGRQPRRLRPGAGPVTLRCAPQVLGAVADALAYIESAIERELAGGHRQPAGVSRGRRHPQRPQLRMEIRRRWRDFVGWEFPRPAAVAAARPPGARGLRAGVVLRAPDVRAPLPPATPGCHRS